MVIERCGTKSRLDRCRPRLRFEDGIVAQALPFGFLAVSTGRVLFVALFGFPTITTQSADARSVQRGRSVTIEERQRDAVCSNVECVLDDLGSLRTLGCH